MSMSERTVSTPNSARQPSGEQAQAILASIADPFFAVSHDWRFIYVNPPAERLLDRPPGALLGRELWEELAGRLGSDFERACRLVASERVATSVTSYSPVQDRWFEANVYPAAEGISIYFQDVSERKRTGMELERLAQASELQRRIYETALSSSADFNYVFDLQGRFVYVNKALLELWGKSLPEAVGRNFHELDYPPELAARLQAQIQEVIATRHSIKDETPYTSAVGERQYEYIFQPVLAADGSVEAVSGSTRDITERKQAERALLESVQLYRAIGESIDYGVWVCDRQGRNLYASESFLRLVGITQQQCEEFGWSDLLHPDDAERTIAAWKACVESGGQWDMEHRFFGQDGNWHPILARGVPVRDERGEITAWAGINLDISRLKQVESELRDADRRKDEFLATLAHELRNPLA
ncbi:MAG: PAS domain-containing protein, partial [Planctomycetota bacterium]